MADLQKHFYLSCVQGSSQGINYYLRRHKVEVDTVLKDFAPFTPLDWALAHGRFDIVRAIVEQHFGKSYDEFIENKFLAHVHGIGGFSDPNPFMTQYEGFNRLLACQRFSALACAFLAEHGAELGLPSSHLEALKAAFKAAPENLTQDPADLVQDIKAGIPVILFTGWHTHINAVIFAGNLVLKCDCGAGATAGFGIEMLEMTNKDPLQGVIADLQEQAKTAAGLFLFTQGINERLGLISLQLISLDKQEVGNCGWKSSEAVFLGLVSVFCAVPWGRDFARRIYERWLIQVTFRVRDEYWERVKTVDTKLLRMIGEKEAAAQNKKVPLEISS